MDQQLINDSSIIQRFLDENEILIKEKEKLKSEVELIKNVCIKIQS